jgi:ABC-type lipoprotein release transport system permease subunit
MAWLMIASTAVTSLRLYPLRSLATIACVVAAIGPYLAGLGICSGLAVQSGESIDEGADLYVTGRQFGRDVPLPLEAVGKIASLPGVTDAVPRIVGKLVIGQARHSAVVVGIPAEQLPRLAELIEGNLFESNEANELVVGSALASRLNLKIGSLIPPFYQNRQGERVSKVVGIFSADAPVWQANLIFTSFETAARLFDQPGRATDVLVYCRPGTENELAAALRRTLRWDLPDGSRLDARVTGRGELRALWTAAAAHRDGVFHLHWMLAISVAVLAVLVTSAFGGSERRGEVGILKAIGWRTDEILFRNAVEGLLLSAAGASLAILLTWTWLRVFNGWAIAEMFVPGLGFQPRVSVPFKLTPLPVVLSGLLSWVVVTSGSLYATWRTAITPPASALR